MNTKQTTPKPPPGHDKTLDSFARALAVPKAEIDKREAEWREKQDEKKERKVPK